MEHQSNTGATRPRITGMAIIFSRLRIIESYGLLVILQSIMCANIIMAPVLHLPSAFGGQNTPYDSYQFAFIEVRRAIVGAHLRVRPLMGGHLERLP
jgi:hypothetical protein